MRQHVHQHAQQYAPGQVFLQRKTPVWSTDVKVSVSGKERRRALWSYPVWKFKVSYDVLRDGPSFRDVQRLYAFFNSMQGAAGQFLYYDHSDNRVSEEFFGLGDGATTIFQLTRSIVVGAISYTEPVFALNGAPSVLVDGVPTDVTPLDNGRVQFAVAPASAARLNWSGGYFFHCRFEADELDVGQQMLGLWEGSSLEFRTVKQ